MPATASRNIGHVHAIMGFRATLKLVFDAADASRSPQENQIATIDEDIARLPGIINRSRNRSALTAHGAGARG
jgi:hypothetical protein